MNRTKRTFSIVVLVLATALVAHADKNVSLATSSCGPSGSNTLVDCTWSDGASCQILGAIWQSGATCTNTRCLTYVVPNTGCKNTTCCLFNTTVNDACTKFTSPKFSIVTTYIKRPPIDKCGPIACF